MSQSRGPTGSGVGSGPDGYSDWVRTPHEVNELEYELVMYIHIVIPNLSTLGKTLLQ